MKCRAKKKIVYMICLLMMSIMVLGCTKEENVLYAELSSDNKEMDSEEAHTEEVQEKKKEIYVYVSGAVVSPNVYVMQEGDRVYHAITKAGGMTEDAVANRLNLAAMLEDGEQIYVLTKEEEKLGEEGLKQLGMTNGSIEDGKININKAAKEELMTLPGIGEAKAADIILYREQSGGFQSIDEIKNISGIKDGVYQKIKERIKV